MNIFGLNIQRQKRAIDENGDAYVFSPTQQHIPFSLLDGGNRSATSIAAVYRCVNLISDSIAMLPIHVKHGNETDEQHPINALFADADNNLSKFQMVRMLLQSVLLRGNGYAYIVRKGTTPVALRYLDPADVQVQYDKQKDKLFYRCATVSNKLIEPVNMLHFKKYSNDGINGVSVIASTSHLMNAAKVTEQTAENMFKKGGRLDGILKMQFGSGTTDQKKEAKQSYLNSISDGVAVLPTGVDYQPVAASSADLQLIEQRKYNALSIAQVFGVPPVLIGLSENTYGSVEALLTVFNLQTLQPYISMFEDEVNRKLLLPVETADHWRVDLDETFMLKAKKSDEATYYTNLTSRGIMTVNEARLQLGLPAVDGADELLIPYTDIQTNKINNTDNESE